MRGHFRAKYFSLLEVDANLSLLKLFTNLYQSFALFCAHFQSLSIFTNLYQFQIDKSLPKNIDANCPCGLQRRPQPRGSIPKWVLDSAATAATAATSGATAAVKPTSVFLFDHRWLDCC